MIKLLRNKKQVIFFLLAGTLSALVEIGSFKIFSVQFPRMISWEYNLNGIRYPLSNISSTSAGIFCNYFLSIWFVFERGKHSKKREFFYFILVSFLSTLVSLTLFQVFYNFVFEDNFDLIFYTLSPEMISKISAILLVAVLNYSVKKRIIFNG